MTSRSSGCATSSATPTSSSPAGGPPRTPATPVALVPATRSDRAVLENLGQLFRYDLSESFGLLPNADGTFNNRPLDRFRLEPSWRAWLVTVAGGLGGFAITNPDDAGATHMTAFFVVRALRRTGVGTAAAALVLAGQPGPWVVGFQPYNPGVQQFWERVATAAVGDRWHTYDGPPPDGRPPDRFLAFDTRPGQA